MKAPQEILALYRQRMEGMGQLFSAMREIRDVYNGDVVLPVSERLDQDEKAAVANLAQQGLDQMGRRVASVLPNLTFPALRPGIQVSETKARNRKAVMAGWWHDTHLKRKMGRRARHWLGYASSPALIVPADGRPDWQVCSPLDVLPAPARSDEITPTDVIVATKHTHRWLRDNYPIQALMVHVSGPDEPSDDMEFTVLRYNDAEEDVLVVCGHDPSPYDRMEPTPGSDAVLLERAPNRAEVCWAVVPGRITLDRPIGHFDGLIGMYQTQAMLMAMEVIATKRAIWPREWIVASSTDVPQIIQTPDPEAGIPGVMRGGVLDRQQLDPSFRADQVMDRLEYAQRMTAALPAELGGMASSNIRTGRRGSQVLQASIDFTIAEAQEVFDEATYEEDCRAIKIDRAYFRAPKRYYISARGHKGMIEYTSTELWETEAHSVDYPLAGADMANLVLEGGQRLGMGTLSKRSFMELDPAIEDAEMEMDRLRAEGLDDAFFASVQTMAADPMGPWQPIHLARLKTMIIAEEIPWEEAVAKLQEEIQKEQATPVEPGAPEAMPGLSMPGEGVEAPTTIPEGEPSMQNLTSLLSQLGVAQMAMRSR